MFNPFRKRKKYVEGTKTSSLEKGDRVLVLDTEHLRNHHSGKNAIGKILTVDYPYPEICDENGIILEYNKYITNFKRSDLQLIRDEPDTELERELRALEKCIIRDVHRSPHGFYR